MLMDYCMVLGDSVAVGIAQVRTECTSYSRVGWTSKRWNDQFLIKASSSSYDTVIISLGANDHAKINTEQELRKMRLGISAKRVFWISTGEWRKPLAYAAIEKIASEFNDIVIPRNRNALGSDGVHPTPKEYKRLAELTKK